MEVHGWGRYPEVSAEILAPTDSASLNKILSAKQHGSAIPRGAGRSYGDSSLANNLLSSRFFDNFLTLNTATTSNTEESPSIRCGAGLNLDAILKVCIPQGLFLPVLPGTKFVTVGGAIAADVHGKNHHRDGSFCDHLQSFRLMLASSELLNCSREENPDLFHGTCGGMGLTGMIVDATLKLMPISSNLISQQSLVASNLEESFELLNESDDSKYSVAWLDCLSRGDALGRSIIYLGEHAKEPDSKKKSLEHKTNRGFSMPFNTPSFLLNRYTMKSFNNIYYGYKKKGHSELVMDYDRYFFPLDSIAHWNRLYGNKGFLQYQFVMPTESALPGIQKILEKVSSSGKGSFLTVLKKFGAANNNLLSFPREGFTLTLDFKKENSLFPLLEELDQLVCEHAGRLYLAKDARMNEQMFKSGYKNWEEFVVLKKKFDPKNVFSSLQSNRIGLTN